MTDPLAGGTAAPLDTLPFAVLIDEAWKATRRNARQILVPMALLVAPAALLIQVLSALWNLQIVAMEPGAFEPARFCGTMAIGGAAMLVLSLYLMMVYGTMMVSATRLLAGETPTLGSSLRLYARPRVWGTDLFAWIVTFFGFFACLLPGLFLVGAWALRLPVMVREGLAGMPALRRSWELLDHNPGRQWTRHPLLKVLLLFLLGMVLTYAVSFVFQAPALIVNQVLVFREVAKGQTVDPQAVVRATLWLAIPAGVLASLAQLAVQLYMDFAFALVYLDQRRRKEGADLASALDQLSGPAGPPGFPGGTPPPGPAAGAPPALPG